MNENQKTIKFFQKMDTNLKSVPKEEEYDGENIGFKKTREKLFKTAAEARMEGRVDANVKGDMFNEKNTPLKELESVDEDLIDAMINRKINDLIGD